MKTRNLTILLVVSLALLVASLAFNVCFTVGYSQAKKRMRLLHSPQARMEFLAKKLNLSQEQYNNFKQRRQSMGPKRQAFLDELIKDKPNQKLLEKLALEKLALRQEFMRDLSPEQRQMFVEIINKRFSLNRGVNTSPAE